MSPENEFETIKSSVLALSIKLEENYTRSGDSKTKDTSDYNIRFTQFAGIDDVIRILDVDCILCPYRHLENGDWPTALIASFTEKNTEIGSMESQGSLWKLTRKDIGITGTHVVLQTSEIGESVQYLSPNLSLTSDPHNAAFFVIKIQPHTNTVSDIETNPKQLKSSIPFAQLIQLELIPRNVDGSIEISYLHGETQEKRKLLVSAHARSGSGEKGLAILNETEMQATDIYFWNITWQVFREDNPVDGFAFLDTVDLDLLT